MAVSGASRAKRAAGPDAGGIFASLLEGWRSGGPARTPIIMGIVNVTPDSFSDGGRFFSVDTAVAQARRLLEEGAAILDIGGESTRKGASPVDEAEEMRRVLPVIEALRSGEACISIDTMKATVAAAALDAGAHVVNDIRGLLGDPGMAEVAARTGAGLIAMHNRTILGSAEPIEGDPIAACRRFFDEALRIAHAAGIEDDRIVLDPGFGFGKSPEQNLAILARLGELNAMGYPVLVGTSRKSFIGAVTGRDSGERVIGTLVTSVTAALGEAAILRVHDVAEHVEAMRMLAAIRAAAASPAASD